MINILKKILAVMLCVVVLFSCATVPVHAVAITATTVGLGVLATGLLACGIVIATDTDLQTGLSAAWASMGQELQEDLNFIGAHVTVYGNMIAHWTSAQWSNFTNWVTQTFAIDGTSKIALDFGSHTSNVATMNAWDYNNAVLYTNHAIGNFTESMSFMTGGTYSYILSDSGFKSTITSMNNSVVFSSARSTVFTSSFSNSYATQGVALYKPTLYSDPYYGANYAVYADIPLISGSYTGHNRAQIFDWYIDGTGISAINGQQLIYNNTLGTITFGNSGITAEGTYTGVADYIYKSVLSPGAVGLPLYPGQDVINPADDVGATIGADVYPDYYPGTGVSALPQELGNDGSIDIPIPTTETEDGTKTVDWPATGTLTPDDVLPRIKTGDIAGDGTLDTDIADSFPIEDVTIPDLPEDTTTDDNKNAKKFKFPTVAITKFPFCIPFDIKNAFGMLLAPAAIPEFDYEFVIPSIDFSHTIHISLEDFDPVAKVVRWFLSALFIFLLIIATKRLIK